MIWETAFLDDVLNFAPGSEHQHSSYWSVQKAAYGAYQTAPSCFLSDLLNFAKVFWADVKWVLKLLQEWWYF